MRAIPFYASLLFTLASIVVVVEARIGGGRSSSCEDPLGAVLEILKCVEEERLLCASKGYSSDFQKYHNGINTNTDTNLLFWAGGFFIADFQIDIQETEVIRSDQVRVRYIETVTTLPNFNNPQAGYPFDTTFYQNEDALVTVDSLCRITMWNQTGPIEEQTNFDQATAEIIQVLLEPLNGWVPPSLLQSFIPPATTSNQQEPELVRATLSASHSND